MQKYLRHPLLPVTYYLLPTSPVSARDRAMLIAHGQFPASLVPPRLEHKPPVGRRHTRQEAVLTTPGNLLRVPCSAHGALLLLN